MTDENNTENTLSTEPEKLPEIWRAPFFSRREAERIVGMSADAFVGSLSGRLDAIFLLAGAMFDLRFNGLPKKADEILGVASEKYPEADFSKVAELVEIAQIFLAQEVQWEKISSLVYGTINAVYKGGITITCF